LVTMESGSSTEFSVVLESQPISDVSINLIVNDVTEGTVSPLVLFYTPANWNFEQTVSVSGVDDSVADGDQVYTIEISPASSIDPVYKGLDSLNCEVTNRNDDGAIAIAASDSHTVAVKADGSVWAWGNNNRGQLGDGTTTDSLTLVQVNGISEVIGITAAEFFTVALKEDGTVWAWGANSSGQLGDETNVDRLQPVQVNGLSGVVAVASGCSHTYGSPGYGHTVALKNDGTVWTWGRNFAGQLGDGTITDRSSPDKVSGLSGIIAVAAGNLHSVALKSDGTVWTWGRNSLGQLGDGTTDDQRTPVMVDSLGNILDVTASWHRTAVITETGKVWAWGKFADDIKSLGIGDIHMIALEGNGSVWAQGSNFDGQLGDGTTARRLTPIESIIGETEFIASGGYHAVAILDDGSVWTWGNNESGQLGDGTTANESTPFRVAQF
jgi:alpha-tubulin suppressor-like RCC1 family protein